MGSRGCVQVNPLAPECDFNSLVPGKFEWNFRYSILQIISVIDGWGISSELALRWMSLDLTDDKSTLVKVMAWCRQATSHYLSQCWPRSLSPYGVTRGPNELKMQFSNLFYWFEIFWWLYPQTNTTGRYWWQVNIGLSYGLVQLGNKPLSQPMLTQIYVIIYCHWATMSLFILDISDGKFQMPQIAHNHSWCTIM